MKSLTNLRLYVLLIAFVIVLAPTQAVNRTQNVITNPSISRRCDALIEKRQESISFKQKTYALLERNRKAMRSAPLTRKTIRKKLAKNYKNLNKRLELILYQIEQQEEQIIRKGCPSIPLSTLSL